MLDHAFIRLDVHEAAVSIAMACAELTFLINDDNDIRFYLGARKEQCRERRKRASI